MKKAQLSKRSNSVQEEVLSPLAQAIQLEYKKLAHLVAKVPPKDRIKKKIDGTGGEVSVSDIVAYQIGWGVLLIGWYEAGLEGRVPQMPGEGFTMWNYVELAHIFHEKHHYDGHEEQDKVFEKTVQRIIEIVEKEHSTGNLEREGVWPWCTLSSGKPWALTRWINLNTVALYKTAEASIRAAFKKPVKKK